MLNRVPPLIFLLALFPSLLLLASSRQESAGTNRLIHEKSPYLQQHARNPVDWHPWGEEAFRRARQEGKPIFLSIGYSTCHWCHVMERESFSNPEIAAILNRTFISIKVDREERPDIDRIYMAFVQASTGQGGWPLNVFLTPERKPFFGGTYFPPQSREGLAGFVEVLQKVSQEWAGNRPGIESSADRISDFLRQLQQTSAKTGRLNDSLFEPVLEALRKDFDPVHGGFGPAPRFPRVSTLAFLAQYAWSSGSRPALSMLTKTLEAMARGGIHDHVGGGFHRYSTDARWFLPHFEKMLYDQAQIARAMLDAYVLSGNPAFAEGARSTFGYVLRDMQHADGGFYSAEDADSPSGDPEAEDEKKEGAFYVWTSEELKLRLGSDYPRFASLFGVLPRGNVVNDRFGELRNQNILFRPPEVAPREEDRELVRRSLARLQAIRHSRPRPLRDDKILTAWNGLMISALARGYQVLAAEPAYLKAAQRAADFLLTRLYDSRSHRLIRHFRDGASRVPGFLDDYVFVTAGLLDLYEADLDSRWLLAALDLTDAAIELFWDEQNGGFFSNAAGDPSVLFRLKEDYDGAEPAPASIAASNLARLSQLAPVAYRTRLDRLQALAAGQLARDPTAQPRMAASLLEDRFKPVQILIAGKRLAEDTQRLLKTIFEQAPPHRLIFLADRGPAHIRLAAGFDILESIEPLDGRATVYICENFVCKLPTPEVDQVATLLRDLREPGLAKLR